MLYGVSALQTTTESTLLRSLTIVGSCTALTLFFIRQIFVVETKLDDHSST